MTVRKRFLRVTNLLFLILFALQFLPDRTAKPAECLHVVWFALGLEILVLAVSALIKKPEGLALFLDIIGFVYVFLILWTLASAKLMWLKETLFPPPGRVFAQFITDFPKIIVNVQSSLSIIIQGYLLAAVVSIPLGLLLGWKSRVGNAATYISRFLSAIPPIVYIPYGIALLPTFRSVSVMVIFLALLRDSPRFAPADFYRLQPGAHGILHPADLRRNDRRPGRSGILR